MVDFLAAETIEESRHLGGVKNNLCAEQAF